VRPLEVAVRPPRHAAAVELHRLGEQLVAIDRQRINRDGAGNQRPEATAAGFVAQIAFFIGGADEDALPRLDHL
jgi:hypothetical protein